MSKESFLRRLQCLLLLFNIDVIDKASLPQSSVVLFREGGLLQRGLSHQNKDKSGEGQTGLTVKIKEEAEVIKRGQIIVLKLRSL